LSICHLLGVAGSTATTDNHYFIMAGFAVIMDYLINILFDLAQERREIPAVCWGLDIGNCPRVIAGSLHRARADWTMIKTALVELLLD
jgi:hypothetical protein